MECTTTGDESNVVVEAAASVLLCWKTETDLNIHTAVQLGPPTSNSTTRQHASFISVFPACRKCGAPRCAGEEDLYRAVCFAMRFLCWPHPVPTMPTICALAHLPVLLRPRHCCVSHSDELPSANALSALQHHLSVALSLSLFGTVTRSHF